MCLEAAVGGTPGPIAAVCQACAVFLCSFRLAVSEDQIASNLDLGSKAQRQRRACSAPSRLRDTLSGLQRTGVILRVWRCHSGFCAAVRAKERRIAMSLPIGRKRRMSLFDLPTEAFLCSFRPHRPGS
jgi:hypothetical protein